MKFNSEWVERVKSANNIVDIIGEHVVLKKSGSSWTGLCPFHSERSPSFSVNENRQLYHCYGCKAGGDLVEFVKQIHGLSFVEALEELAERARIALPVGVGSQSQSPEQKERQDANRKKLETARKLNRFALNFFQQSLKKDKVPQAAEYLRQRGVNEECQQEFFLGVAPPAWDELAKYLQQAQAPLDLAAELGLVRVSPQSVAQRSMSGADRVGYYDLFRSRIIFPIIDLRGKVVGFGGRWIPGLQSGGASEETGQKQPKYLNSSESLLFHKSKVLYGLYQAAKHIRESDEVIVVEGYFDVLALHRAGFRSAVATCGTALTVDHLNLLSKFASKVTIVFDGDRAGQDAVDRSMELGLEQGKILRTVQMPLGKDPDELLFDQQSGQILEEGKTLFAELLSRAEPILDRRIRETIEATRRATHDGSLAEAKSQAIKQVSGWLRKLKDPVGRELRVTEFSRQIQVSESLVRSAIGGGSLPTGRLLNASSGAVSSPPPGRPPFRNQTAKSPAGSRHAGVLSPKDRLLLRSLLSGQTEKFFACYEELVRLVGESVSISQLFENSLVTRWAEQWLDQGENRALFLQHPEKTLEEVPDLQLRSMFMEFLVQAGGELDGEVVRMAFFQSGRRLLERFSHRIRESLASAESSKDAELEAKLKKDYLDVQRKMKEFSSFYDQGPK